MLLFTLLACGPPAPVAADPRPDLVLLVIDTLRADHVGAYGYTRPTTPNLDALAARGVLFERAYAQSSWTLPSFASLFTGLLPHEHRAVRDGLDATRFGALAPELDTLAERLQRAGYATAAILNNTFLAPQFGLNQGFDRYDWRGASPVEIRSAQETVQEGLNWLNIQEKPAFLVLHFMEPHTAYDPPAATRGAFVASPPVPVPFTYTDGEALRTADAGGADLEAKRAAVIALYDEEILAADQALGALARGLEARARWPQTTLVVTSDHGEEHWDHGGFEHGHALAGEVTRAPLIAVGAVGRPRRVSTITTHLDLHHGLLDLAGAPTDGLAGENLWRFGLGAAPDPGRVALSESCLYGPELASIVDDRARLIANFAAGYAEAWAVDAQGGEGVRLQGAAQQEVGARLLPQLSALRPDRAPIAPRDPIAISTGEVFQQLTALGYLDGRATPE